MNKLEEYSDDMFALLFAVKKSIRYHDHRVRFFVNLHKLNNVICILGGSTVVLFLSKYAHWSILAGGVVVVSSTLDLVFGFSSKAKDHEFLKRRFIELEDKIINSTGSNNYEKFNSERLKIETDEPPKLYALDVVCHNEVIYSIYSKQEVKEHIQNLAWLHKHMAQFFAWRSILE